MSFASGHTSVLSGVTRRLKSPSAPLPLSTTLLLTIGSLPLPGRPTTGWC